MIEIPPRAPEEHSLPAEDCRAQLARMLNSAEFDATDRERRFLIYVVEEALSGRASRIKAYSIAIEVFGRDASFEPQTDPIVRIAASHLRRTIERYYLTAGQADRVLIAIPKGGYVPSFSDRLQATVEERPPSPVPRPSAGKVLIWLRDRWMLLGISAPLLVALVALAVLWRLPADSSNMQEIPRLLVKPFDDHAGTSRAAAVTRGLRQEIIGELSKFRDIVVVESTSDFHNMSNQPPPRFVLAGSVDLSGDAFRIRVRLVSRADDAVLWAKTYDGGMKVAEILDAEVDIARKVATSLGQTYGVLFQADTNLHRDDPPDNWVAYACTLSFYAYRATLEARDRASIRTCLERAVDRFPNYATAWALLSLIYIDDYRFSFQIDREASSKALDHAFAASRRAVELDPLNVRGLQAEMFALYYNKQIDAALSVGKQALSINPNDTELMRQYGERLMVSGNWPEGCPLITESHHRNPVSIGYYDSDFALCSYFSGDYSQAAMWIKKSPIPGNAIYHLIAAAVFGEGGYKEDAQRESGWLREHAPALVNNLRDEVSMRLRRQKDVEFFLGSLEKAGLKVSN